MVVDDGWAPAADCQPLPTTRHHNPRGGAAFIRPEGGYEFSENPI